MPHHLSCLKSITELALQKQTEEINTVIASLVDLVASHLDDPDSLLVANLLEEAQNGRKSYTMVSELRNSNFKNDAQLESFLTRHKEQIIRQLNERYKGIATFSIFYNQMQINW